MLVPMSGAYTTVGRVGLTKVFGNAANRVRSWRVHIMATISFISFWYDTFNTLFTTQIQTVQRDRFPQPRSDLQWQVSVLFICITLKYSSSGLWKSRQHFVRVVFGEIKVAFPADEVTVSVKKATGKSVYID